MIMNKDIIKGIIAGICITLTITFSIPVIAKTTDSFSLNAFRIKTAENTIVDWGQPYTTGDEREIPATISYDDVIKNL